MQSEMCGRVRPEHSVIGGKSDSKTVREQSCTLGPVRQDINRSDIRIHSIAVV